VAVRNMNFGDSTDIDVTNFSIRFKFKTWKGNKSMWIYIRDSMCKWFKRTYYMTLCS